MMRIFSEVLNKEIDIDGYVNNDNNIVIHHKSIRKFITQNGGFKISYNFIKSEVHHSVVCCQMDYIPQNRTSVEIGETLNLVSGFEQYPVMTATAMAHDRAFISVLGLPNSCYSSMEFVNSTKSGANATEEPVRKESLENYVLDFNRFAGENWTVKQAFEYAKGYESVDALIQMYLSKNAAEIKDEKERKGVIALQRYAKQIHWKEGESV